MANEISNDVTIISVDNMIYQVISKIQYSFSKRPDKYRILNFIKGSLDGNEIDKTIFWQRFKILKKEGEINKPSKKGNSLFLPKDNFDSSFNINHRSIRKFRSCTPPCSQIFFMSCLS